MLGKVIGVLLLSICNTESLMEGTLVWRSFLELRLRGSVGVWWPGDGRGCRLQDVLADPPAEPVLMWYRSSSYVHVFQKGFKIVAVFL